MTNPQIILHCRYRV